MNVREVVILREVADDLNDGKAFYDQREPGVGDYFWDSESVGQAPPYGYPV